MSRVYSSLGSAHRAAGRVCARILGQGYRAREGRDYVILQVARVQLWKFELRGPVAAEARIAALNGIDLAEAALNAAWAASE